MDKRKLINHIEAQIEFFEQRSREYKDQADEYVIAHGRGAYVDTLRTLATMDTFMKVTLANLLVRIANGEFDN